MFKTIAGRGRRARSRVAEQPPGPGQPLQRDHEGSRSAARPGQRQHRAVPGDPGAAGGHAASATRPSRSRRARRRTDADGTGRPLARRSTCRAAVEHVPDVTAAEFPAREPAVELGEVSGGNDGVTYAPEGGYYRVEDGDTAFTHGVQIGMAAAEAATCSATPRRSSQAFAQSNPQLRASGSYTRDRISGRNGTAHDPVERVGGHRPARIRLADHDPAARRQRALHHRRGAAERGARLTRTRSGACGSRSQLSDR